MDHEEKLGLMAATLLAAEISRTSEWGIHSITENDVKGAVALAYALEMEIRAREGGRRL
jgi:hypothetical protein